MAAETLTGSRAAATFPVFQSHAAGLVCAAYGSYAVAANTEAGDIFEMCKVPAGAVVLGGTLYLPDIDSNATETLDLDVGWKANADEITDTDGFGNFGVVTGDAVAGYKPEVGTLMPLGGVLLSAGPKTFTAETTIQVIANDAAATFAAGTISLVVYYVVP